MKSKLLSLLAVTAISMTANAGFKSELFLGGSSGGQLSYKVGATTYTFNNSSVPVGFMLGYKSAGGFVFGAKYTYMGMGYLDAQTKTTPTLNPSNAFTHHSSGIVIGFESAKFRLGLNYNPGDTLYILRSNSTTQTNEPDTFYGNSTGLNIGYKFNEKWALDLGYLTHTYTHFDQKAVKYREITSTSTFKTPTDTNVMLNIVYTLSGGK